MALKGNLLMEAEGGPKVLRVGSWFDVVSKKTFLAMELERVFPNSKSINSKDLWNRNSDFSSFDQPEISNQISKKMAQLFTETYEKEIIPDDAQFLITTDGRVSWVDGDQWFQIDHSNWNWDSFYAAVVMDFLTWSAKEPQFGKKVFEEILARIQKFPEAKRAAVLSELKSDMDHPVWVFRDRKDSERVRVPFREVLKIYGVETDPNSPKFPYRLTN